MVFNRNTGSVKAKSESEKNFSKKVLTKESRVTIIAFVDAVNKKTSQRFAEVSELADELD